jgi:hypothetical protein
MFVRVAEAVRGLIALRRLPQTAFLETDAAWPTATPRLFLLSALSSLLQRVRARAGPIESVLRRAESVHETPVGAQLSYDLRATASNRATLPMSRMWPNCASKRRTLGASKEKCTTRVTAAAIR